MLIYLAKSAACMALCLAFYKLLLERENMHVFKRLYLVLALIVSLVIPALVFTEYVVMEPTVSYAAPQSQASDYDYVGIPRPLEQDALGVEPLLWGLYFLGFTFFGLRFLKNLFQIIQRIRKNPTQKSASFIRVLLLEKFPPHTFFKYIFLNKATLEANKIPQEVLVHEETHARERHSLDVVFIELLQVVFWFNPMIVLFKKAIKLNHEFLADRAVLKKDVSTTGYQNTLLSYLSPDSEKKYQPALSNAINYSSIKKRFTIMKTQTSKRSIVLRSVMVVPLLALLLLSFSTTEKIPRPASEPVGIEGIWLDPETGINQLGILEDRGNLFLYLDNNTYPIAIEDNGFSVNIHGVPYLLKLNASTGNLQFGNATSLVRSTEGNKYLKYDKVIKGSDKIVYQIEIVIIDKQYLSVQNKLIPIDKLALHLANLQLPESKDTQPVFIHSVVYTKKDIDQKVIARVDTMLSDFGADSINIIGWDDREPQNSSSTQIIRGEESALWHDQFEAKHQKTARPLEATKYADKSDVNVEMSPILPKQGTPQDGATKKQLKEYNRLAKKYNAMPKSQMRIKIQDVERLQYLHSLMNDTQRGQAEPFPEFPPAPEFPEVPEPPQMAQILNQDGQHTGDARPRPAAVAEPIQSQEANPVRHPEPRITGQNNSLSTPVPAPPAVPEPPSPLDHAIAMAKRGATFYYEGTKISADKAIKLLKENKSLNMDSRDVNGEPTVKISKKPILIGTR